MDADEGHDATEDQEGITNCLRPFRLVLLPPRRSDIQTEERNNWLSRRSESTSRVSMTTSRFDRRAEERSNSLWRPSERTSRVLLPTSKISDKLAKLPSHTINLHNMKNVNGDQTICCAICLEEMQKGQRARSLPKCGHAFHLNCVDRWLTNNFTCPNCRKIVALS